MIAMEYFINYPRQPMNKGHPDYVGCRGQPTALELLSQSGDSRMAKDRSQGRHNPPDNKGDPP